MKLVINSFTTPGYRGNCLELFEESLKRFIANFPNVKSRIQVRTDFNGRFVPFYKFNMLRESLTEFQDAEWHVWLDCDGVITNPSFNICAWLDNNIPYWVNLATMQDWNGLCTGVFFLRRCQWSLDFLNTAIFWGQAPSSYDLADQGFLKMFVHNAPEHSYRVMRVPSSVAADLSCPFRKETWYTHAGGDSESCPVLQRLLLNGTCNTVGIHGIWYE